MSVTAPEFLSAHRALATDDLEEARHRVAAEFCAHRLEPVGRAGTTPSGSTPWPGRRSR